MNETYKGMINTILFLILTVGILMSKSEISDLKKINKELKLQNLLVEKKFILCELYLEKR